MGFSPTPKGSVELARALAAPPSPPTSPPDVTQSTELTQPPPPSASPVPLLGVPLRLVGVIGRLYVVLESDRGLVLLDQHAAHERILFEQMLNRLVQKSAGPPPP